MSDEYEIIRKDGTIVYILWNDVTVEEDVEMVKTAGDEIVGIISRWTASFEGRSYTVGVKYDTEGPLIRFSREGRTAQEAAKHLEEAATQQKWEMR